MHRNLTAVSIAVTLIFTCAASAGEPSVGSKPAAAAVKRAMGDFTLTDATLVDALAAYQTKTGAKITVNWEALRLAQVTPDSKVSVAAKRLTFAQVLDLTLARVRGAKAPLCWIITGKNVHVTTQAAIIGARRDLLSLGPRRPAPRPAKGGTATRPQRRRPTGVVLDFDDTPAEDVVAFFRGMYPKMNIFVAWKSLETVGVAKDTPVTLKITQPIPLMRALDLVVDTFNGGKPPRDQVLWDFNRGVLTITTGEVLDRKMEVRTYDVADLLIVIPDFVGPQVSIQRSQASSGGDSGSSFAGDNSRGFGSNRQFGQSGMTGGATGMGGQNVNQVRRDREQALIEIIRNAIGEEYWQPTGKGSIRIIRGQMIISQSRLGFRLLSDALSRPRRRRPSTGRFR